MEFAHEKGKKNLEVGTKYLSGVLSLGNLKIPFAAFKNESATDENKQPHYKVAGGGGGIWITTKKGGKSNEL